MMATSSTLILLPGLNCTRRLWQAQIDSLAADVACVVPDVAAHDSLGALATAILDAAPPRFALAGLSMGGYVAFEILRRAPERVERLALVDTQARADDEEARDRRRTMIRLASDGRFDEVVPLLWSRFVAKHRLGDTDLERAVRDMAIETGAAGFVRQQTLILGRPDSRPDLPKIACPTLVLVGADDQVTPPALAREIADAIPGARLVVLEGAGHLAPLEKPAETTVVMRQWLFG